jgi:isoleucyl-tRNA synthetase
VWLTINGGQERFDESILLVTYIAREGMHAAGHQGVVVSLDLTVTEELKREGLAREMVRHIQEARKQMGCDITDRIVISVTGEYPQEWIEYVCRETLSEVGEVTQAATAVEIEGEALVISIAMA